VGRGSGTVARFHVGPYASPDAPLVFLGDKASFPQLQSSHYGTGRVRWCPILVQNVPLSVGKNARAHAKLGVQSNVDKCVRIREMQEYDERCEIAADAVTRSSLNLHYVGHANFGVGFALIDVRWALTVVSRRRSLVSK
jgi:hypothetical protein